MKYIVYTRLAKLSGETIEVCVVGVEAHSAGGAEHRLLDSFQTVTNALAFDMDSEMQFANPYMAASHCMSFAEFAERADKMREANGIRLREDAYGSSPRQIVRVNKEVQP